MSDARSDVTSRADAQITRPATSRPESAGHWVRSYLSGWAWRSC